MNITAVIPIREGSERVKDKNIRKFGDTNLLQFKIDVLKKSQCFSKIVVNTDSKVAIDIAKLNNVDYHEREPYYASSDCSANEYFEYLGTTTDSSFIAYTPVTAPFIKIETFRECISEFDFSNPDDTIITGSIIKDFLFFNNNPLNFSISNHPKSQDFCNVMDTNFGLCLLSRSKLLETKSILGSNPRIHILSGYEGIDIDTAIDFEYAEFIYSKIKSDYV